eukprot:CAMPEP_0170198834 /NCGR_PEP_ID=MMETSP0040_2-20121228/69004_1 /TAXON_ID=641309 /ORGANISM="Lotharella oceanica, Strain CCMP622" /LENGTH=222 /DNA_ID=CAMNT_0010448891 /DNA_START=57 /DNA_END=726 /DNA_ORIENTATION=+
MAATIASLSLAAILAAFPLQTHSYYLSTLNSSQVCPLMTGECAGGQQVIAGVTYDVKPGTLCAFPYFARNAYTCPDGYQNNGYHVCVLVHFGPALAYCVSEQGSVYPVTCDCNNDGECGTGLFRGCVDNQNDVVCSSDYKKVCYNGGTHYTCLNCEGTFYNYDCGSCECSLNGGAVAGVVLGIVAGVILIGVLCCCVMSCLQAAGSAEKRGYMEESKLDCPA